MKEKIVAKFHYVKDLSGGHYSPKGYDIYQGKTWRSYAANKGMAMTVIKRLQGKVKY